MTITAPPGATKGDLAVIAIAVRSNSASIIQPNGQFTLVSRTTRGGFAQSYYWHRITSSGDNSWDFVFNGVVRAEGGVLVYRGTCLNKGCPGGNPIVGSSARGQTGTQISTGTNSVPAVPSGETVAAFGAAEDDAIPKSPSGGLAKECGGDRNAGLLMADKTSSHHTEGPFAATAPLSVDNVGNLINLSN